MLLPQNLLRTTNPLNFSSIGQILLSQNIFSQRQQTRFEKTSLEITLTEILKIKIQYLKIQIPLKTEIQNVYRVPP